MHDADVLHGSGCGFALCLQYLFVLLLHLALVISQFFVISAFLGSSYWLWGLEVVLARSGMGPWTVEQLLAKIRNDFFFGIPNSLTIFSFRLKFDHFHDITFSASIFCPFTINCVKRS
jgi:hypothetical protein